jgi:hypothetical protein
MKSPYSAHSIVRASIALLLPMNLVACTGGETRAGARPFASDEIGLQDQGGNEMQPPARFSTTSRTTTVQSRRTRSTDSTPV